MRINFNIHKKAIASGALFIASGVLLAVAAVLFISCGGGDGGDDGGGGGGSPFSFVQLPIYVLYVNHVEVESVIPSGGPLVDGTVYASTAERYAFTKEMLTWETAIAESVGGKISFHISGAFAERALGAGDRLLWEGYIGRGHSVGVHTHGFLRGSSAFEWIMEETPTEAGIRKHWEDNYSLAGLLVGAGALWVGESHYACAECWADLGYSLRSNERAALLPAGEHIVWLVERDPDGVVTYPHFPQIGAAALHGPAGDRRMFDLRLPQLKKEFLMLYVEWLSRERLGLAPQVWAWGFANHGGDSTQAYKPEIEGIMTWLRTNFVERLSSRGNTIVRFVNDHELKTAYEFYGQAGGTPLPSPSGNVNDQFPYMAFALSDAGVTEDLSGALGADGVRMFELQRSPPTGPEPEDPQKVYLLFREWGDPAPLDISGVLGSRGVQTSTLRYISVTHDYDLAVESDDLYLDYVPQVLEVPQ